ncbi:MAG: CbiX/SirB N-terminal domain-containing protein [Candidatus Omnitrophica bacterium]|nr:CbiX/SirB N-terminal domain-containing protein [Candidatus Omnitrophota bacterium]
MKAVLLVSHGSRITKTKQEVLSLIEKLKNLLGISFIECAFLEIETPSIPDAIAGCINKGATEIIVLLNFLNAGRHVDTDIPRILNEARQQFPNIRIILTKPIGQHWEIPQLFSQIVTPYLIDSDVAK